MSDPDFFPALDLITMPMDARAWATTIMNRLRDGGLDLPLGDKDGFTVQDIITVAIERAIQHAKRPAWPAEPPPDPEYARRMQREMAGFPEPIRDDGKLA